MYGTDVVITWMSCNVQLSHGVVGSVTWKHRTSVPAEARGRPENDAVDSDVVAITVAPLAAAYVVASQAPATSRIPTCSAAASAAAFVDVVEPVATDAVARPYGGTREFSQAQH